MINTIISELTGLINKTKKEGEIDRTGKNGDNPFLDGKRPMFVICNAPSLCRK